jgi:TPR repeat protein
MRTTLFLFMLLLTTAHAQEEETEALSAMRLGCMKSGVALGCYNYANMLVRSDKVDEADKYYERGCKLKHEGSCQKQKWDIPDRVKTATTEITPAPTPAPASVEEEEQEPVSLDMGLDTPRDINE